MKFTKLWAREYSVQYTEVALRCVSEEAKRHLPSLLLNTRYIPEQSNEACYVESKEWNRFLRVLNKNTQSTQIYHNLYVGFMAMVKNMLRLLNAWEEKK